MKNDIAVRRVPNQHLAFPFGLTFLLICDEIDDALVNRSSLASRQPANLEGNFVDPIIYGAKYRVPGMTDKLNMRSVENFFVSKLALTIKDHGCPAKFPGWRIGLIES